MYINLTVTGRLFMIGPLTQVSESFKKRSFVVEYIGNPQYPDYFLFELIQEKCDLLDGFIEKE